MALSADLRVVGWTAQSVSLLPLAWLALTRSRNIAYWWVAGAFGISFVADTASHWLLPWTVASLVYPLAQAAIIAAVFLSRKDAEHFAIVLACAAILSALVGSQPDVFVHTVAFGGLSLLLWPTKSLGLLRVALLIAFGGWLVGWYLYVLSPGWLGYAAYQSARLIGILGFCKATLQPRPVLRMA